MAPSDVDADGIPDAEDRCPYDAGVADQAGCPALPAPAAPEPVAPQPVAPATPEPAAPPAAPVVSRSGMSIGCRFIDLGGRKVTFATDHYILTPQGRDVLDDLAGLLSSNPSLKKLRIEGHIDVRDGGKGDDDLTLKRVWVVREYLRERGIDKRRLGWRGLGSQRPITDDLSAAGRTRNRRVEFRILSGAPDDCPR